MHNSHIPSESICGQILTDRASFVAHTKQRFTNRSIDKVIKSLQWYVISHVYICSRRDNGEIDGLNPQHATIK
jgi:hypothetical protein